MAAEPLFLDADERLPMLAAASLLGHNGDHLLLEWMTVISLYHPEEEDFSSKTKVRAPFCVVSSSPDFS